MLNKICFIITTFLRDELLYKSVNSLIPFLGQNKIIIVDQGNLTEEKFKWLEDTGFEAIDHCCPNKNQRLLYYQVPFDSGLSYCRNYGVKKAKESDCQYVFIGSDSFLFNNSILKLHYLIEQKMFGYNIIGVELQPSVCGWEGKLNLIEGESFELDFLDKKDPSLAKTDLNIYDVDICRNCFLAETNVLINTPWDENLKLAEHEDEFYRLKLANVKVGWTSSILLTKQTDRPTEYAKYRKEHFDNGMRYLLQKYHIKHWIKYVNLERAKEKN